MSQESGRLDLGMPAFPHSVFPQRFSAKPRSPFAQRWREVFFNAVPAAGLALSLALAWMASAQSGCPIEGCGEVWSSPLGKLVGIPVGWFAAALWASLFVLGSRRWQLPIRGLLAAGGVYFLAAQLFWIEGFCILCAAHSVLAVATWWWREARPVPVWGWAGGAAGILLGGLGMAMAEPPGPTGEVLHPRDVAHNPAWYWLGPQAPESPWLVLSFTCGHCWVLLDGFAEKDPDTFAAGPGLIFLTNERNQQVTELLTGAVLSLSMAPADALRRMSGWPESLRRQIMLGQTGLLHAALEEEFPGYRDKLPEAHRLLDEHLEFIKLTGVPMTPYLFNEYGGRGRFTIRETFLTP